MNTQVYQYNSSPITFQLGNGDALVNATEMAQPFGKRPAKWLELPSTKEFLKALSAIRKSDTALIRTQSGGISGGGGTWFHEDVALEFARWLSPAFAIWCNDRIKELMKYGITATPQTIDGILDDPDNAIKLLTALKTERAERQRLAEQNLLANEQIMLAQPKVEYYEKVLQSGSLIATNIIADQLGVSAVKLNQLLMKNNVIYRQNDTYVLFAKHRGQGYEGYRTHSYISSSTGQQHTKQHLYWTEKGREFIINLIKRLKTNF